MGGHIADPVASHPEDDLTHAFSAVALEPASIAVTQRTVPDPLRTAVAVAGGQSSAGAVPQSGAA